MEKYLNNKKLYLVYINKIFKELKTSNTKKNRLKYKIEYFKINTFLKNPNKGGRPPNEKNTKILKSLEERLVTFNWLDSLLETELKIKNNPKNNQT